MRALNLLQTVVAIAALAGITILGALERVDSNALVAIYSAVIGAGLAGGGAIVNGVAQAKVIEAAKEEEGKP